MEQKAAASATVFEALASGRQIPTILQNLRDSKDVTFIANNINLQSPLDPQHEPPLTLGEGYHAHSNGIESQLLSTSGNDSSETVFRPNSASPPTLVSSKRLTGNTHVLQDNKRDTVNSSSTVLKSLLVRLDGVQSLNQMEIKVEDGGARSQRSMIHASGTGDYATCERVDFCTIPPYRTDLSSALEDSVQPQIPNHITAQAVTQLMTPPQEDTESGESPSDFLISNILDMLIETDQRSLLLSYPPVHSQVCVEEEVWGSINLPHVFAFSPFHHSSVPVMKHYLDSFLQSVNSTFYFFDADYLQQQLATVLESSSEMMNSKMSELCLVLALGAQMSYSGQNDAAIMWYENGRRYLDDENRINELWIMRVTALISMFHIAERPGTARHYLG